MKSMYFVAHQQGGRILLVVRAGSIGDFILTLPVLQTLRQQFNKAYLEFILHPLMFGIVGETHADCISSLTEHPELDSLLFKHKELPIKIVEYLSSFDLIIWYGYDPNGIVYQNLHRINVGPILVTNPFPPEGAGVHASDHALATLRPLGLTPHQMVPHLNLSAQDRIEALRLLGNNQTSPLLAIHPGSGLPQKNWEPHRFATFIRLIMDKENMKVLLLTGPTDKETVQEVKKQIGGLEVVILDTLPLGVLAALLEQCVLFVGNDSGVTHLAAAVGTPTVAIFGPTDPQIWAPRGKHVFILRKEKMPCSPCSKKKISLCPNRQCLNSIKVTEVMQAAEYIRLQATQSAK